MSHYVDTDDGTWREVPSPNFPPAGVVTLREHDETGKMTAIWEKRPGPHGESNRMIRVADLTASEYDNLVQDFQRVRPQAWADATNNEGFLEMEEGYLPNGDGTLVVEHRIRGGKEAIRTWWRESELPKEPGFYLVNDPQYGTGPVVIELLGNGEQWIDCADRNYLTLTEVENLAPLTPLRTEQAWREKNGVDG
jgi:hypothetical protein